MFDEGAFSYYLKATTTLEKSGTVLYMLYNYTTHDVQPFDGQELNVVAQYPITDDFRVSVKLGVAERIGKGGAEDTISTDSRLFVTYYF